MPPKQETRRTASVQKPNLEQPTITSVLPSSKRKSAAGNEKPLQGIKLALPQDKTLSSKKTKLNSPNADDFKKESEETEEASDFLVLNDEEDGEEDADIKILKELDDEFERSQKEKIEYNVITTEQLIEVHWDHLTKDEKKLRKFDLDPKYGPAVGITRLARWNRAKNGGLKPSQEIYELLTGADRDTDNVKQSLFHSEGL